MFFKKKDDRIGKLTANAGNIIEMLKHALRSEKGLDMTTVLLFAAGLSGIACHEAVKAYQGHFELVTTKGGRKYYFGDEVNKYLFENDNAVVPLITAVSGNSKEEVEGIIKECAENITTDDNSFGSIGSEQFYQSVKQCWDGIFNNMTGKYCNDASEWPILFGIVLQNIILQSIQVGAPKEEAGKMAIECAYLLSKIDDDTFETA